MPSGPMLTENKEKETVFVAMMARIIPSIINQLPSAAADYWLQQDEAVVIAAIFEVLAPRFRYPASPEELGRRVNLMA